MKRMKSFDQIGGALYLVATPIGNLEELTPRALSVLNEVDVIAAEDTRNTIKLLNHFQIKTKLITHHQYNEKQSSKGIIELLQQGKKVAIVSDAGYPLISDPGSLLVQEVIESNFPVIPISGANAMLNALVCSGLASDHFMFYGFLSSHENERKSELLKLEPFPYTMAFYEAPHRIKKMLNTVLEVFGDRNMVLARELTKRHEEFIYGTVSEIIEIVDELKGEMVVLIEGKNEEIVVDESQLIKEVNELVEEGIKMKEAAKKIAEKYGVSKNELYRKCHKQ